MVSIGQTAHRIWRHVRRYGREKSGCRLRKLYLDSLPDVSRSIRCKRAAAAVAGSHKGWSLCLGVCLLPWLALAPALSSEPPQTAADRDDRAGLQLKEYAAERPKTIIELQPFRQTETMEIAGPAGTSGQATLINLNPTIGAWYLLRLNLPGDTREQVYHLQPSEPGRERLSLDGHFPDGIIITGGAHPLACALWSTSAAMQLAYAQSLPTPYAPLCDGHIYLRNATRGHKTLLEDVTDFLRDKVWGGEQAVKFVRDSLLQNPNLEIEPLTYASIAAEPPASGAEPVPEPAAVDADHAHDVMGRGELGLDLDLPSRERLAVGQWYPLRHEPAMFASAIEPKVIDGEILRSHRDLVNALDRVEADAVVYLVAFDLSKFDLGFALGTDHPRVGWSDRTLPQARDNRLPGPDGIDIIKPLVATGMVSPPLIPRVAATFVGGFKREHSAFKWGDLALRNHGSHSGFIEEGVIASRLHPGLATLYVMAEGRVDMKTWTEADNRQLALIRYARQNGVSLIDFDETRQISVPGALVGQWGAGNWSGSQDKRLRTLRAGACLQQTPRSRFLVYGYFSGATPSAMVRVFQAYHCRSAMQLDINALEHTYLSLYNSTGDQRIVEHLVRGMSVLDERKGDLIVPRFIGYADNRDFFYLLHHGP